MNEWNSALASLPGGIADDQFEIPLEGKLRVGIYFVNIYADNGSNTHKLIIQ